MFKNGFRQKNFNQPCKEYLFPLCYSHWLIFAPACRIHGPLSAISFREILHLKKKPQERELLSSIRSLPAETHLAHLRNLFTERSCNNLQSIPTAVLFTVTAKLYSGPDQGIRKKAIFCHPCYPSTSLTQLQGATSVIRTI